MEESQRIENPRSRLRAFSRRRNNLIKKANKLVKECGVEVSVVVISPSGQISHFSSDHNMGSILQRYVSLSLENRHANDPKLKEKQAILAQLEPISSIENKCLYLDLQTSCLEKQVNISKSERQLTEDTLRNFEPDPDKDPSMEQLDWCEENLMRSLNRLAEKKNEMIMKELRMNALEPSSSVILSKRIHDMRQALPERSASSILMQLDPWISPFSTKIRESIIEEVKKDEKGGKVPTVEVQSNNHLDPDQAQNQNSKGKSVPKDQSGVVLDADGRGTMQTDTHLEMFGPKMMGGNTNFPFPAVSQTSGNVLPPQSHPVQKMQGAENGRSGTRKLQQIPKDQSYGRCKSILTPTGLDVQLEQSLLVIRIQKSKAVASDITQSLNEGDECKDDEFVELEDDFSCSDNAELQH